MSWAAWFPVLTLILGSLLTFAASIAGPWILEERAEKRRRRERWADFQRDNLIALQEALADDYAVSAEYMIFAREVREQLGSWPPDRPFIPRVLAERQHAAGVRLRQITGRLADDQVRELVETYRGARRAWHTDPGTEGDRARETTAIEVVNQIMDRACLLIRESWAAEPPRHRA